MSPRTPSAEVKWRRVAATGTTGKRVVWLARIDAEATIPTLNGVGADSGKTPDSFIYTVKAKRRYRYGLAQYHANRRGAGLRLMIKRAASVARFRTTAARQVPASTGGLLK